MGQGETTAGAAEGARVGVEEKKEKPEREGKSESVRETPSPKQTSQVE